MKIALYLLFHLTDIERVYIENAIDKHVLITVNYTRKMLVFISVYYFLEALKHTLH